MRIVKKNKDRACPIFFLCALMLLGVATSSSLASQVDTTIIGNSSFKLEFADQGISSLKKTDDSFDTDYILEGHQMGNVVVRFRRPGRDWSEISTREMAANGRIKTVAQPEDNIFITTARREGVELKLTFRLEGDRLLWNIGLTNNNSYAVEVGDVALPFPMNHDWSWDPDITYNKRVIRHSMISGHNSFLYWMRSNTVGPYLLMTPVGDTHLEYFDQSTPNEDGRDIYTAYIHSLGQKEIIEKNNGNWRQPHTGTVLQGKGKKGNSWKAGFKFQWEESYKTIREQLYEEGLFNIHSVPGMTVPEELPVKVALRNKFPIHQVEAEFPMETRVRHLRETPEGYHIYEVQFGRLGENKLTVKYGSDRTLYLEYFITESLATLINKRAAFIVDRQQIRGSGKWYEGLFSDWSMKDKWLLTPEETRDIPDGRRYMISSDDPALSRPSFLAKKNVSYPVQKEVSALDYYIDNFVWGGLQMTTEETYPYAIYGIHDWKMNRESEDPGQYGKTHIWRIYDYPHIVQMYISMYHIASYYPAMQTKLSAEEYLERAYGTALAFYTVPNEVIGWSPYHTGNYNELSILDVIDALEKEGMMMEARRLRQHWEKKVDNFVSGEVNLFGSEYSYDTTGFESTGAFARYAMSVAGREAEDHDMLPLDVSREEAEKFMKQQIAVNVGTRGWLEKAYYLYGSDYRGSGNSKYLLSYMAPMGGWSLLDYSLHYADNPNQYMRLSYASILSSWALMNTGTEESNYGYWYPGKINDGGAGGGFEPMASATNWLGLSQKRGSWYYGCEIDLGFTGYLRAASTILTDDPIFGITVFGGLLKEEEDVFHVTPKDGLRRRFHALWNQHKIHISLQKNRFAADSPISISTDGREIVFDIENVVDGAHSGKLRLAGLPEGTYDISIDNKEVKTFESDGSRELQVDLPIKSALHRLRISESK